MAGDALRFGFAGTPAFAAIILRNLLAANRVPAVVYCQPDRPVGRGRREQPSPVKALALEHDLAIKQPVTLRDDGARSDLDGFRLDLLVVAAYGLLLPGPILEAPRLGCLNVHASLLPRWRGAAPVERAIMAGDTMTGVSIMQMDRGLDTGPVLLMHECAIGPRTTGPELELALADLGSRALLESLDRLPELQPHPQKAEGVTYARKLSADDAIIDWHRTAGEIDRQVRALCGRLPAVTFADSVKLQILEAEPEEPAMTQALPGTVVTAARSGILVASGHGTLLRIVKLRLNRGKGVVLTAGQAINGFPDILREGRLLHAQPL